MTRDFDYYIKPYKHPHFLQYDQRLDYHPMHTDDTETLFKWQCDPRTRKYMRNSKPPTWKEHKHWVCNNVDKDTTARVNYVFWDEDYSPCGLLRFDFFNSTTAEVSIYIDPDLYGMNYGYDILSHIDFIFLGTTFLAEIHKDNIASQRIFKKCGFRLLSDYKNEHTRLV